MAAMAPLELPVVPTPAITPLELPPPPAPAGKPVGFLVAAATADGATLLASSGAAGACRDWLTILALVALAVVLGLLLWLATRICAVRSVRWGIHRLNRFYLGLDVEIGSLAVNLCSAKIILRDVTVLNPPNKGYVTPYMLKAECVYVNMRMRTLLCRCCKSVVVQRLILSEVHINLEKTTLTSSNVRCAMDHLESKTKRRTRTESRVGSNANDNGNAPERNALSNAGNDILAGNTQEGLVRAPSFWQRTMHPLSPRPLYPLSPRPKAATPDSSGQLPSPLPPLETQRALVEPTRPMSAFSFSVRSFQRDTVKKDSGLKVSLQKVRVERCGVRVQATTSLGGVVQPRSLGGTEIVLPDIIYDNFDQEVRKSGRSSLEFVVSLLLNTILRSAMANSAIWGLGMVL